MPRLIFQHFRERSQSARYTHITAPNHMAAALLFRAILGAFPYPYKSRRSIACDVLSFVISESALRLGAREVEPGKS